MTHNAHFAFIAALASCSFGLGAQSQVSGQGNWETALQARKAAGDAMDPFSPSAAFFYDTTTDVTWMADPNANGLMDWHAAKAWAAGLNMGSHNDWRLPHVATGRRALLAGLLSRVCICAAGSCGPRCRLGNRDIGRHLIASWS